MPRPAEPYRSWAVIFVEPRYSQNVGYVARVMANFGLEELILVSRDGGRKLRTATALKYASHGARLLETAKVTGSLKEARAGRGLLAATTAIISGKPSEVLRSAITPGELVDLAGDREDVAIVLGRDTTGLTNDEIAACDYVVHVPTWTDYPTMNVSHALAVILYEVAARYHAGLGFRAREEGPSREELDALDALVRAAVQGAGYEGGRAERTVLLLRRLAVRASRREVRALMGVLRRLLRG